MTEVVITAGSKGKRMDLLLKQGATWGPYNGLLKRGDGTPIDLTGATMAWNLRKEADSPTIAGSATFVIAPGTTGAFSVQFTPVTTAALTCSPIDENEPESRYVHDWEVTLASTQVIPLAYGEAGVYRNV